MGVDNHDRLFFTGGSVVIDYGQKRWFKGKKKNTIEIFVSLLHKMLIVRLELCRLS